MIAHIIGFVSIVLILVASIALIRLISDWIEDRTIEKEFNRSLNSAIEEHLLQEQAKVNMKKSKKRVVSKKK